MYNNNQEIKCFKCIKLEEQIEELKKRKKSFEQDLIKENQTEFSIKPRKSVCRMKTNDINIYIPKSKINNTNIINKKEEFGRDSFEEKQDNNKVNKNIIKEEENSNIISKENVKEDEYKYNFENSKKIKETEKVYNKNKEERDKLSLNKDGESLINKQKELDELKKEKQKQEQKIQEFNSGNDDDYFFERSNLFMNNLMLRNIKELRDFGRLFIKIDAYEQRQRLIELSRLKNKKDNNQQPQDFSDIFNEEYGDYDARNYYATLLKLLKDKEDE
jgi:hypothetical protein